MEDERESLRVLVHMVEHHLNKHEQKQEQRRERPSARKRRYENRGASQASGVESLKGFRRNGIQNLVPDDEPKPAAVTQPRVGARMTADDVATLMKARVKATGEGNTLNIVHIRPPKPTAPRAPAKVSARQAERVLRQKLQDYFTEVRKAFRKLDEDRSGGIGPVEFQKFLAAFGIECTEGQFALLFSKFDPDTSGEVSFEEFVSFFGKDIQGMEEGGVAYDMQKGRNRVPPPKIRKQLMMSTEEVCMALQDKVAAQFSELRKAFRAIDFDNGGSIGREEIQRLLHNYALYMSEPDFEKLWTRLDVDGNGEVSFDEFVLFFGGLALGDDLIEADCDAQPQDFMNPQPIHTKVKAKSCTRPVSSDAGRVSSTTLGRQASIPPTAKARTPRPPPSSRPHTSRTSAAVVAQKPAKATDRPLTTRPLTSSGMSRSKGGEHLLCVVVGYTPTRCASAAGGARRAPPVQRVAHRHAN